MKKNVALVAGKTDYPPMGALYIADALEQAGFTVRLHESSENNGNFLRSVKESNPLFVGFSVHTWPIIVDMVDKSKLIKENLDVPVVWGGIHPTFVPEGCLAESFIDYIVMGDGEVEVVRLAEDLLDGTNLDNRRRHGATLLDLDNYRPAWHLVRLRECLFDASHSVRGNNTQNSGAERIFYYLMSSRGCPFNCTFCYNSHRPKQPWRGHSAGWVKEQVLFLKKNLDIDGVGFWDDFFLGDRRRAVEIIEFLHGQGIKFLCEARATDLNDEFTSWLKKMGCLQIFVGAESGSNRVLEMINKKTTVEDIIRAAEVTHKYNLPARFSFIYGFPGETIEEMFQTKALVERLLGCSNVSISGPKLLTPYPGSLIYEQVLDNGFVVPADTAEWANINRFTDLKYLPWLAEELQAHGKQLSDLF
jgi:anaerobic magnesium-protoporphyrin IX monomethyl ester cyclase